MLFEKASRAKLRFKTSQGNLTVEDLWDLKLPALDNLAISLNKRIKEASEESFIKVKSKSTSELELQFEIVKHIIQTVMQEDEAREKAKEIRQKRAQLLNLIEHKEQQAMEGKSIEELRAELEKLEA